MATITTVTAKNISLIAGTNPKVYDLELSDGRGFQMTLRDAAARLKVAREVDIVIWEIYKWCISQGIDFGTSTDAQIKTAILAGTYPLGPTV